MNHPIFSPEYVAAVNDVVEKLKFIYHGGRVKRFHTRSTLAEHTVGHHSFGVAWFCVLLTDGKPSAALLMRALAHDLGEVKLGDIPSPTKRELGLDFESYEAQLLTHAGIPLPTLTSEEERLLKLADTLDGFLSCSHEKNLGNATIAPVYNRYRKYLEELEPVGIERVVISAILKMTHPDYMF